MGLQVHQPEGRQFVVLDEKLWLTADREHLVPDGHRDAAFLFGTPGKRVDIDEAKRLGLVGSEPKAEPAAVEPAPEAPVEQEPEPTPEPVKAAPAKKAAAKKAPAKAAKKPADKAVKAPKNKGG